MAAIVGVSYVTYQEIEKGIIKKTDYLKKLKENTGFDSTQKNMYDPVFPDELQSLNHLAQANNKLSNTNAKLVDMLESLQGINSSALTDKQLYFSLQLNQIIDKMAKAGVSFPGLWETKEQGQTILDKLLGADVKEKQL